MTLDPRIQTVVRAVNAAADVDHAIGDDGHVSPLQIFTLIAACAVDDAARKALVSLVYGAVELSHKAERDQLDSAELESRMRATLALGGAR